MEHPFKPLETFIVDKGGAHNLMTTAWGEAVRLRVSRVKTSGAYSMLDYYASAKFGPPVVSSSSGRASSFVSGEVSRY